MFLFDAGSFSSHGRFAVNDLAEKERRCSGGLGLKEKGIKARAAANHQRLISISNLCTSVQVSSLERFHAICAISGNSGSDSVVYYCQIIVASDFSRPDDEFYV